MQVLVVRVHCVGRKMIPLAIPAEAVEVKEDTGVAGAEVDREAAVAGDPVEAVGDGQDGVRELLLDARRA